MRIHVWHVARARSEEVVPVQADRGLAGVVDTVRRVADLRRIIRVVPDVQRKDLIGTRVGAADETANVQLYSAADCRSRRVVEDHPITAAHAHCGAIKAARNIGGEAVVVDLVAARPAGR